MAAREGRASWRRLLVLTGAVAVGVAALVAINAFSDNLRLSVKDQARSLLGRRPGAGEPATISAPRRGGARHHQSRRSGGAGRPVRRHGLRAAHLRHPAGAGHRRRAGLPLLRRDRHGTGHGVEPAARRDMCRGRAGAPGTTRAHRSATRCRSARAASPSSASPPAFPATSGVRAAFGARVFIPWRFLAGHRAARRRGSRRVRGVRAAPRRRRCPEARRALPQHPSPGARAHPHRRGGSQQPHGDARPAGQLSRARGPHGAAPGRARRRERRVGVHPAEARFHRGAALSRRVIRARCSRCTCCRPRAWACSAACWACSAASSSSRCSLSCCATSCRLPCRRHRRARAIGLGLVVGLWVSTIFALLPLLSVRRVPPLAALRRDVDPSPSRRDPLTLPTLALLALSIVALTALQVGNWRTALYFSLGIGGPLRCSGSRVSDSRAPCAAGIPRAGPTCGARAWPTCTVRPTRPLLWCWHSDSVRSCWRHSTSCSTTCSGSSTSRVETGGPTSWSSTSSPTSWRRPSHYSRQTTCA